MEDPLTLCNVSIDKVVRLYSQADHSGCPHPMHSFAWTEQFTPLFYSRTRHFFSDFLLNNIWSRHKMQPNSFLSPLPFLGLNWGLCSRKWNSSLLFPLLPLPSHANELTFIMVNNSLFFSYIVPLCKGTVFPNTC